MKIIYDESIMKIVIICSTIINHSPENYYFLLLPQNPSKVQLQGFHSGVHDHLWNVHTLMPEQLHSDSCVVNNGMVFNKN